jgi:hypothetical protein
MKQTKQFRNAVVLSQPKPLKVVKPKNQEIPTSKQFGMVTRLQAGKIENRALVPGVGKGL